MSDLAARYDLWHVILTAAPVAAAACGALVIRRWPQVLGRTVALYALLCIGVALSPVWLGAVTVLPDAGLRPVLEETRFAFALGLAILLAAGGSAAAGRASGVSHPTAPTDPA
jgi:hypothetical protein